MSSVRILNVATGLACAGFLAAGFGRVALAYARDQAIAAPWHLSLEIASTASIVVGVAGYVMLSRQRALQAPVNEPLGYMRLSTAVVVLLGVTVLAGAIGLAAYAMHAGRVGEARLWLAMALNAFIALPAFSALLLRYRCGPRAAF